MKILTVKLGLIADNFIDGPLGRGFLNPAVELPILLATFLGAVSKVFITVSGANNLT